MKRTVLSITFRRKREINSNERLVGTLLKYHTENKTAITASERNIEMNTFEPTKNTPVYTS